MPNINKCTLNSRFSHKSYNSCSYSGSTMHYEVLHDPSYGGAAAASSTSSRSKPGILAQQNATALLIRKNATTSSSSSSSGSITTNGKPYVEVQHGTACFYLISERAQLVHPWPLKTSHLNTASFHYLRNSPVFHWSLTSPFFLREVSYQVPAELSLAHQLSSAAHRGAG